MEYCTVNGKWLATADMGLCCCRTSPDDSATVVVPRASNSRETPRGCLLVFVNPHSGKGKSLETFERKVAPRLDRENIQYELLVTTGPNHARNVIITRRDIASFNGILILSGDGLVFEVLNGILARDEWAKMLANLPISIVPSGSGNGLLCSVLANFGESLKPKNVLRRAVEIATSPVPRSQPVSLYHVETDKQHIVAFLSIGWGIMADIDIESEKWRKTLGSNRFTVGALIRSINLRQYKGRLSFKPYAKNGNSIAGAPYNVFDRTSESRIISEKQPDSGTAQNSENWEEHHIDNGIPPIGEPTGDEWTVIEDDFIGMYAVTLSHISADGPFAPNARLDDDRIYLTYILRKDVSSRMDMIKFLSAIEKSKHLDLPFCKKVEVSSFRLETMSEGSYVVVDGEVIDTKSIQVTSTSLKMAVFSPESTGYSNECAN